MIEKKCTTVCCWVVQYGGPGMGMGWLQYPAGLVGLGVPVLFFSLHVILKVLNDSSNISYLDVYLEIGHSSYQD